MTLLISEDHPQAIDAAIVVIQKGGIIAFPTDTVYGLACNAFNTAAIQTIYRLKGRDFTKAIPILVGEINQIGDVAGKVDEQTQILIDHFWPGALTVIVPKKPELPKEISRYPTIGVRMPDHSYCLNLLKKTGPLAVTSANLSGFPEALTAKDVAGQMRDKIEIIIDGGKSTGGMPSTIVDCSFKPARIIREGAIKSADIFNLIG